MYARTTLLEIDTLRVSVDDALARFNEAVLPALREQPGFSGVYVLTTPEGRAMLISFWDSAEQAEAGSDARWYSGTLEQFMTLFRAPPGSERYEVRVAIAPVVATSGT